MLANKYAVLTVLFLLFHSLGLSFNSSFRAIALVDTPCDDLAAWPGNFSSSLPRLPFSAPHVQVFAVTAPSMGNYWERYYINSNGWHRQFPDLTTFAFDKVKKDSPLAKVVSSMELLPNEVYGRKSNLQLAALGEMFKRNPSSQWYFLVDDDTIVVKQNLDRMIAELDARGDVNETEYYMGKCVTVDEDVGEVHFVVGGAGILMNRKCLSQLAPRVDDCRRKYGYFQLGDARIGACLDYTLKLRKRYRKNMCEPKGYTMTNNGLERALKNHPSKNLVVTLHEKGLENLERINEAISYLTQDESQGVTWRSLKQYLSNKTKPTAEPTSEPTSEPTAEPIAEHTLNKTAVTLNDAVQ